MLDEDLLFRGGKMIEKLLGLLLLLSPFLIGWAIFMLGATFIIILIICGFEGILAWIVGLALLLHG